MKPTPSPAANKRTLAALAGAILLASLGISIATVALPSLATVFAVGVQQVQWVVLAYLLALTCVIVVAGRMGDLYGNRRVLIGGILLFTLASAGCAVAPMPRPIRTDRPKRPTARGHRPGCSGAR